MKTEGAAARSDYLPDFCTSRATLAVVLIVELTAFVLTLARQSPAVDFWTDLARTSLFLLWVGLAGAGLLCALRRSLVQLSVRACSTAVLALIAVLVAVISLCVYWIGRSPMAADFIGPSLFPTEPRQLRGAQRLDRIGGDAPSRCATSTSPTSGASASSCAPLRGCTRCRRASGRTFSSTA